MLLKELLLRPTAETVVVKNCFQLQMMNPTSGRQEKIQRTKIVYSELKKNL